MSERFFLDTPLQGGTTATLAGPEAQHLAKVMRAAVGDEVTLFDGSGLEFVGRIERIGRQEVQMAIVHTQAIDREWPRDVTLAVALPKGDRQQWLVEKATELGVTRIVPLIARRGVAQPVDSALARLRRYVVEASKQCGRNRLLEIAPPQAWPQYAAETVADVGRYFAHLASGATAVTKLPTSGTLRLAVGPEGGWTDEEAALALAAGWRTIDLGPRILRVETAAIALAVLASPS